MRSAWSPPPETDHTPYPGDFYSPSTGPLLANHDQLFFRCFPRSGEGTLGSDRSASEKSTGLTANPCCMGQSAR